MLKIGYREIFIRQFADAITHYSYISPSLVKRLALDMDNSLSLLENNPGLFRIYHKEYRRYNLKKFPYFIIYKLTKNTLIFQYFLHQNSNLNKRLL